MTRKPEITFEYEETIVLKQGGKLTRQFCPRCGEVVDMLSPDVLYLVTGATEREIYRLVEQQAVHFAEAGGVVVCLPCLRHYTGGRARPAIVDPIETIATVVDNTDKVCNGGPGLGQGADEADRHAG